MDRYLKAAGVSHSSFLAKLLDENEKEDGVNKADETDIKEVCVTAYNGELLSYENQSYPQLIAPR